MKKSVYTAYSAENDMTFILEDTENTTTVKGFYWGEPDEESTKYYYGKLTAKYDM